MRNPASELDELAAYFRSRGFHSKPRIWAPGHTVFVAAQPKNINGIVGYRRAAYAILQDDGSWHTIVHGIKTSEALSTEGVRHWLSELLNSSDVEYQCEFARRADLVVRGDT